MRRYEKEEKKMDDAETAFINFVEKIKTIDRSLLVEDEDSGNSTAICKVQQLIMFCNDDVLRFII